MLDSMQQANFTQILCRFHAAFAESKLRHCSEILAESFQNPSGILAESMRNLSMPYPCLIACSIQDLGRFQADFSQILGRFQAEFVPES